jgi:hypothetical protein
MIFEFDNLNLFYWKDIESHHNSVRVIIENLIHLTIHDRLLLRYTYIGNVNQNVKVAVLSLIVEVTEKTVYPGNDK